ncbi:uncharacterized protein LOC133011478 [Limanda limanda]|uniref:uncharacterized protein LOC133011478 n=1 Tax=Limanda limanda TaxID=27771 RepID=UPI0029C84443|nr:uncharacterized protein LOC133011478 [Limanda limanda]
MFGRLAALILFGTKALILTAEVPQLISLTAVERGNNISLKCLVSEDRFFYWYKQSFGHVLQTVASSILHRTEVNDSRFTLTRVDDRYLLNISNVSKEDEATYFCQNGRSYQQTFIGGTFLAVNDQDQQKHYSVKQSPETASVRPGASVILQCLLLSRHKENLVQCPDETKVKTRSELDPLVLVLAVLLVCCVTVIVVISVKVNQTVCKHCKGTMRTFHHKGHGRSSQDQSNNWEGEAEELTYVAPTFFERKARVEEKRESPHQCLYSSVKRS